MPSPFPGMGPYFEGELWPTFHVEFGVDIAHQLTPTLAPRYIARPERRYLIESVEDFAIEIEEAIPDIGVRQISRRSLPRSKGKLSGPALEMPTLRNRLRRAA